MHIDDYKFGHITIDGRKYSSDVIIYNDKVDGSWWRKEGHRLQLEDIRDILAKKPEILIIGTGADGCMAVPDNIILEISKNGIKVIVRKTGDAVKEFNSIAGSAGAIAALHLTC